MDQKENIIKFQNFIKNKMVYAKEEKELFMVSEEFLGPQKIIGMWHVVVKVYNITTSKKETWHFSPLEFSDLIWNNSSYVYDII